MQKRVHHRSRGLFFGRTRHVTSILRREKGIARRVLDSIEYLAPRRASLLRLLVAWSIIVRCKNNPYFMIHRWDVRVSRFDEVIRHPAKTTPRFGRPERGQYRLLDYLRILSSDDVAFLLSINNARRNFRPRPLRESTKDRDTGVLPLEI